MIAEIVLSKPMLVEVIIGTSEGGGSGLPGKNGLSAYELALLDGFVGTPTEWLASLKGNDGKSLEFTWNGTNLGVRKEGDANYSYVDLKGASAYEVAVQLGFTGTAEEFITSLKGADGHTPVISILPNGNWAVDGSDTGTKAQGVDGKSVEIQKTSTAIQWRREGDVNWIDLILLSSLVGEAGKSVELQKSATAIQWRREGEVNWHDLALLSDLKGENGVSPHIGENGNWVIGTNDTGVKAQGKDGQSAYEAEKAAGTFTGTYQEWLAQFENQRSHLLDSVVHITAPERKLWNSFVSPLIVNSLTLSLLYNANKKWINVLGLSTKQSNNSGGLDRNAGAEILYQLTADVVFKLTSDNQADRLAVYTVMLKGSTYAGAWVSVCNITTQYDNIGIKFSTTATQTIRPADQYTPGAENNILSAYIDRTSIPFCDYSTMIEVTVRRAYKESMLSDGSDKSFDDSFISYNYSGRTYDYDDNSTSLDLPFVAILDNAEGLSGKLEKGTLPAGIATAYDILQKIGIDQNADLTTLLANTSNALFNALANSSKDTLVEIIKWLIESKIDTASTINEWAVGITQPGQKEVMGLLLKMIVSDGSAIVVPAIPQKPVVLTAAGQIQMLNDAYAGKYYVIKNAYLVARNLSGVTQYPTISIGCNASNYNDIAASQTLNTLVNGVNAITLTANASKALIEANANMVLNITTPIIGQGTFLIILEGMIC